MRLVDNARQAWKWFSVQAMGWAIAIQGGWMAMPDGLRDNIPPQVVDSLTIALLVLGIAGRLVKQGKE